MFAWQRKWSFLWAATENPMRDELPRTVRIWDQLALEPAMSVADVGAGLGYFAFKIAERLGPHGHVLATEASPRAFLRLGATRRERNETRMTVRWRPPWRLGLAPRAFDRVLMVDVFAFVAGRRRENRALLRQIAESLRPRGRFVLAVDAVHTTEWRPPYGTRLFRAQASADEIVDDASSLLELVARETLITGPPELGKLPGHLLVFRRS